MILRGYQGRQGEFGNGLNDVTVGKVAADTRALQSNACDDAGQQLEALWLKASVRQQHEFLAWANARALE